MLEVGWSEILVIALILIIVVGPRELPGMLRTFGRMATRLRGMANEFKGQFDEALREAELDDVRKGLSEVNKLNPTNSLRDAINPLRQLGQDIKSDLQKATDVSLKPEESLVAKSEDKVPEVTTALQPAEPVVARVETPDVAIAKPSVAAVSAPARPVVADTAPVKKPAVRKKAAEPVVVAESPKVVSKPKATPKKAEVKADEPKRPAPRKRAVKAGDA